MNHAELIKKLFTGHATATSAEATLFFQGAGLSYKAATQALARAFRDGLIRRKKMKRAKGYEFRLASRYPKFGKSYAEEMASRPAPVSTIEQCRKHSRLVEFNNRIAGARQCMTQ